VTLPHSAAYPVLQHVRDHLAGRRRLFASPARADEAAGTVTVVISGELDFTSMPSLAEQLAQVLARKPRRLVFDMAQVSFIDCASARLIVGMGRNLPDGRQPVIRRPGPAVRRILELTGLDAHCQVER
jgi:anti-sigma B factor antagonist